MSFKYEDLKKEFPAKDLEWRVQKSGEKNGKPWAMILCYVDARAVMDRLDEVCGPNNWKDHYEHLPNGVKCTLSVKSDGEWIPKEDGSPETDIESFKGGISKALVRTAVKWGIGRYLYDMPVKFADFTDKKTADTVSAKIDGKFYNWIPPNKVAAVSKPTPAVKKAEPVKKPVSKKSKFDPAKVVAAFKALGVDKSELEDWYQCDIEKLTEADRQDLSERYVKFKNRKVTA